MKRLIMGCGQTFKDNKEAVRLDINKDHKPDVVWDLNKHPLPFKDETFSDIQAHAILEHLGTQGDAKFFFDEFSEYWRILKPLGTFHASIPDFRSQDAWGDPSHRRIMTIQTISFLSQDYYDLVGKTSMSDFRYLWKKNFNLIDYHVKEECLHFLLQKV